MNRLAGLRHEHHFTQRQGQAAAEYLVHVLGQRQHRGHQLGWDVGLFHYQILKKILFLNIHQQMSQRTSIVAMFCTRGSKA